MMQTLNDAYSINVCLITCFILMIVCKSNLILLWCTYNRVGNSYESGLSCVNSLHQALLCQIILFEAQTVKFVWYFNVEFKILSGFSLYFYWRKVYYFCKRFYTLQNILLLKIYRIKGAENFPIKMITCCLSRMVMELRGKGDLEKYIHILRFTQTFP